MSQSAAGTLNQYPNLIELVGRHSGLLGAPVWSDLPIGSDEIADGIPLPAVNENLLQDEFTGPLIAVSVSGHEAIGQDELDQEIGTSVSGQEVIGQDEIEPLFKVDAMSICSDEQIGQDEVEPFFEVDAMSICSDETETIGQDEISGSPPAFGLDRMSICNDENILQDELPDIAQVGTASAS